MPAVISRKAATRGPTSTPRALFRFPARGGQVERLGTMITLLLAAALLAGCSARVTIGRSSDTVDPAKIAYTISRQLRKQLPPGGWAASSAQRDQAHRGGDLPMHRRCGR